MDRDRQLFECQCVGVCTILAVERWAWDSEPTNYEFEFYSSGGRQQFRHRFKQAWSILRGNNQYLDALCLSEDDALRMAKFLGQGHLHSGQIIHGDASVASLE